MAKILRRKEKGAALLFVLATVLVLTVLANALLAVFLSQSRLTHRQVSRIQAYYACLAGRNYAFEMLRRGPTNGGWDIPAVGNAQQWCIASNTGNCPAAINLAGHSIADGTFPPSIRSIVITIANRNDPICPAAAPVGIDACIQSRTDYTHTD